MCVNSICNRGKNGHKIREISIVDKEDYTVEMVSTNGFLGLDEHFRSTITTKIVATRHVS